MKSLTKIQLNRIKIKDMIAVMQKDIDPNIGMGLYRIEFLAKMGKDVTEKATDNDLEWIEGLFIKSKLGIEYFPSQSKKKVKINGKSKIVPIDYDYGSENT
jgi:hypothetical protein